MQDGADAGSTPSGQRCAECGTLLAEGQDRQATDDGVFCRPCFEQLSAIVHRAVAAQGEDVNYPMALVGGLGGAAVGVLAWWGFTVLTNIAFGLVAVVIGIAVGKGMTLLAGGKRHRNLQILSVAIATLAYFYASYLVQRSFIVAFLAEQGEPGSLPLIPTPDLFVRVVSSGFQIMDLVFLAIVVYEAWKIPAPLRLAASA